MHEKTQIIKFTDIIINGLQIFINIFEHQFKFNEEEIKEPKMLLILAMLIARRLLIIQILVLYSLQMIPFGNKVTKVRRKEEF